MKSRKSLQSNNQNIYKICSLNNFMKIQILLLFFVLMGVVSGASIEETLAVGNSLEFKGKNITLLAVAEDEDRIMICVNGEKGVIGEDDVLNGADIKSKDIESDYVTMRVIVDCEDCVCDESCDNSVCAGLDADDENDEIDEIVNPTDNSTDFVDLDNEESEGQSYIYWMSFILLLMVIVVLVFVLLKKR
jgi:hypothetical protein